MGPRLIGYWRNDEHPEYPDPHDLVDESWDEEQRSVVGMYFSCGTFVRGYMGLSPCRFCGRSNGSSEYTDGVLVWPEGLSHYIEDHGVRLPKAIERYVLAQLDRLDSVETSLDWWVAGAPAEPEPLEPLERLVWHGNAQLVQQPGRRFPGLFVQGDTLAAHVDGPESAELLGWYEELMTAAGISRLPYSIEPGPGRATNIDPSSVSSRDGFADFLEAVLDDFRAQGGRSEWENAKLDRFLEALAAFAAARVVESGEQETPSWSLFAEMIAAATGYECRGPARGSRVKGRWRYAGGDPTAP